MWLSAIEQRNREIVNWMRDMGWMYDFGARRLQVDFQNVRGGHRHR